MSLASKRPGTIFVNVRCFGPDGPFADRAGWDPTAQYATGLADAAGKAVRSERPHLTPAPISSYFTGVLGAYGGSVQMAP